MWVKTKQSTILAKCKRLQHNKTCEEIVNSYLVSTDLSGNSHFSSGTKICSVFSQAAKNKIVLGLTHSYDYEGENDDDNEDEDDEDDNLTR